MKAMAFSIVALAALLSAPKGANALTPSEVFEKGQAMAEGNFPVIPGEPSRLALEYRLGTHVEALARKYGQLDQAGKRCNIEGAYFEEDSLADVLGNALPDSSVGIAKRAYAEGQTLDTPPCDQIDKFMSRLLGQVERHKKAISHDGYYLMLMNSESRD